MRRDLLHLFLPQLTVHVDTNKQLKVNRKTTSVQVQLLSTGDAKISSFSSPEVLALSHCFLLCNELSEFEFARFLLPLVERRRKNEKRRERKSQSVGS